MTIVCFDHPRYGWDAERTTALENISAESAFRVAMLLGHMGPFIFFNLATVLSLRQFRLQVRHATTASVSASLLFYIIVGRVRVAPWRFHGAQRGRFVIASCSMLGALCVGHTYATYLHLITVSAADKSAKVLVVDANTHMQCGGNLRLTRRPNPGGWNRFPFRCARPRWRLTYANL